MATISSYSSCSTTTLEFNAFKSSFSTLSAAGKGAFGTLPYLVVEYDDGKEKQCNFKHEEDVDRLLAYVEVNFPQIPLHSEVAEQKLAEKAKRMEEKQRIGNISETAKKNIRCLDNAIKYLHKDTDLY